MEIKYSESRARFHIKIPDNELRQEIQFEKRSMPPEQMLQLLGCQSRKKNGQVLYWFTVSKTAIDAIVEAIPDVSISDKALAEWNPDVAQQSIPDYPQPASGWSPYPYQIEGYRHIARVWNDKHYNDIVKHPLLCDEQGLGKTAQTLQAIAVSPYINTVLIVCKGTLIDQWEENINIWLDIPDDRFTEFTVFRECMYKKRKGLIGKIKSGFRKFHQRFQILITSYDMLKNERVAGYIEECSPDLCVVDEFQYYKNSSSARSIAFAKLSPVFNHLLWLTGTPLDKVSDLKFVLRQADPKTFGVGSNFDAKYNNKSREGAELLGKEIKRSGIYKRRTVNEVKTDLPPLTEIHVPIDIDSHAQRELDDLLGDNDYIQEAKELSRRISSGENSKELDKSVNDFQLTKVIPYQHISKARSITGRGKVAEGIKYLQDKLNDVDKIVFLYHHHHVAASFYEAFKGNYIVIKAGERNIRDKVNAFRDGPEQILFSSVAVIGEGIDGLQKIANTIILLEYSWSLSKNEQALKRLHRDGQTDPVMGIFLVANETIDVHIMNINRKKREISMAVKQYAQ